VTLQKEHRNSINEAVLIVVIALYLMTDCHDFLAVLHLILSHIEVTCDSEPTAMC